MPIRLNLTPGQTSGPTTSRASAKNTLRLFSFGSDDTVQPIGVSATEDRLISAAFAAAAAVVPEGAQELATLIKEDPVQFHAQAEYDEDKVRQILTQMHDVQSRKTAAPAADGYTRHLARSIGTEEGVVASGIAELNALPEAERQIQALGLAAYAVSVASESTRDKAIELGLNRDRLELVSQVTNRDDPDHGEDHDALSDDLKKLSARVAKLEAARPKKAARRKK